MLAVTVVVALVVAAAVVVATAATSAGRTELLTTSDSVRKGPPDELFPQAEVAGAGAGAAAAGGCEDSDVNTTPGTGWIRKLGQNMTRFMFSRYKTSQVAVTRHTVDRLKDPLKYNETLRTFHALKLKFKYK